jgi:hypothetical protein
MTDSDSVRAWRVRIQEDLQQLELLAEATCSSVRDLEPQVARLETRLNLYQRDLQVLLARLDERLDRHEVWLRFLVRLYDLVRGFLIFVWLPHAENHPNDENWSI